METYNNKIHEDSVRWINNIYHDKLEEYKQYDQLPDNFYLENCLSYSLSIKYNFSNYAHQNFEHINRYFHTVRTNILMNTAGKNWRRHIHYHPLMITFCDIAGSKYRKRISNNDQEYDNENNNPHHHGIILIHPYHYEQWNTEKKQLGIANMLKSLGFVQTVKIESLNTSQDREKWFSYAGKLHFNNKRISDNSMMIFNQTQHKSHNQQRGIK